MNKTTFNPGWIVQPGMIVEEYLEALCMTQSQLALRTGLTPKTINEIINGKATITHETACMFEKVLDMPAHFWNNLEANYREQILKINEKEKLQQNIKWLEKFPVNFMIKSGWLPKCADKADQVNSLLHFFGISNPDRWNNVWEQYQPIFRRENNHTDMDEYISVWLRQGEIEALKIECKPYNKTLFRKMLSDIRQLTLEIDPEIFIPQLKQKCALAGVAVVFVSEVPEINIHGATRWMKDKAIIQLSLSYKSNDHLWFTFFHEAGHILLHRRDDIFIECKKDKNEKEKEADVFSQSFLIPSIEYERFIKKNNCISENAIIQFAKNINIAPGIIVGRLQHDGKLKASFCNKLKLRYKWD